MNNCNHSRERAGIVPNLILYWVVDIIGSVGWSILLFVSGIRYCKVGVVLTIHIIGFLVRKEITLSGVDMTNSCFFP